LVLLLLLSLWTTPTTITIVSGDVVVGKDIEK